MRLESWSVVGDQNPYLAPEARSIHLQGYVFGHPNHKDGTHVITSPIVGVDGRLITTKSGHTYQLGEVNPEYQKVYHDRDLSLNAKEPIKLIKP
jgi:hypothetical protein